MDGGSTDGALAEDAGGSGGCAEYYEGCICRLEPFSSEPPFAGTCSEAEVGDRAICCQGSDYCNCEPVLCGISNYDGNCLCGVGVAFDFSRFVASCDGTDTTCCTNDTGYCYCEDGCEARFGSRLVASCNESTAPLSCDPDYEVRVSSCE